MWEFGMSIDNFIYDTRIQKLNLEFKHSRIYKFKTQRK